MILADSHTLRAPSERQVVAGVALLATPSAGLIVSVGLRDAKARDVTLRTCAIVRAWADRSAIAWCTADGAAWRFDPRSNTWYPLTVSR